MSKIFQIFYNKTTCENNDKGFLQLDNSTNTRSDWREYHPIRNYILTHSLEINEYIGFFSPKFKEKTGLSSHDVYEYLEERTEDVVSFSPFFDAVSFNTNTFEQGEISHPGIIDTFNLAFSLLDPKIILKDLIMPSKRMIYCNFFVAKKDFWLEWLHHCERLFIIAERGESQLSFLLNRVVNHLPNGCPAKVFVIERMASYILTTQKKWTVNAYDPLQLPYEITSKAVSLDDLIILSALKTAYWDTSELGFLKLFHEIRWKIYSASAQMLPKV
jgi:hypothetical protein